MIKIATSFLNPDWLDQLEDVKKERKLTDENIAEAVGITKQALQGYKQKKNNPKSKIQEKFEKYLGIKFESISIRELILKVIHISDKKLRTNAKRIFVILILYPVKKKAPGSNISMEKLKEECKKYGYKDEKINDAIEQLKKMELVKCDENETNIALCFDGCKEIIEAVKIVN